MEKKLVKDIIQWDVKSWSKILEYWDNEIDWSEIQNGLELGGREGGLSLWLALKGKNVLCSDLHDTKEVAELLHLKYNVLSLVDYQDIDATDIPYENVFDVIMFKSIMGGIGNNNNIVKQQKAFDEIYKALKPGGLLLFAENLVGSRLHRCLRKKYVRWGNSWRYVSMEEMQSFLNKFSSCKIETTGFLSALGRNETQRMCLATIDKLCLNRICPAHWKYIVYGIAKK